MTTLLMVGVSLVSFFCVWLWISDSELHGIYFKHFVLSVATFRRCFKKNVHRTLAFVHFAIQIVLHLIGARLR